MNKMKIEWLIGATILGIAIVIHGYLLGPGQWQAKEGFLTHQDSKGLDFAKRENSVYNGQEHGSVMDLTAAALYLSIDAEDIKKMIAMEEGKLEQYGHFSGAMIPYFMVDDHYYFTRTSLDLWLSEAVEDNRIYDTTSNTVHQ